MALSYATNAITDGELPRGWQRRRFAEIADYTIGRTPPRNNPLYWSTPPGVPWVSIADIEPFGNITRTAESIALTAVAEVFRKEPVRKGTLLMSFKLTIGRTAVLGVDAYHNEAIIAILPRSGVERDYLRYFLPTIDFSVVQDRAIKGNTLNKGKIDSLPILLPPPEEQRAIASILSEIQNAVALESRRVDALKKLWAATTEKVFREGLRGEPLKHSEKGEIPISWEVRQLHEVASIERGKFSHRPRNDPRFYGGAIPFIQTGDVVKAGGRIRFHTQTLNELGLSVSRVFPRGTIVLTIAANIGDTGILEFASAFPDSLVGITPLEGVDSEFLELFLRTQKPEMDRLAPKGTQKNINIQFLRPWPIKLPPLEEQQEIARLLLLLDARLYTAEGRRELLRRLFESALNGLMTGHLRVTPASGQPKARHA
jgi:type I restriction enzyme S subunit